MPEAYDYVIVGAGSAGCVLARRLSEQPSVRVLLLDAGPDLDQVGPEIASSLREPARFQLMQDSAVDWKYRTEPQKAMNDRRILSPRGRIVGGSSTFMAGMAIRGNRHDFDEWARESHPRWCYAEVLPTFKKLESNRGTTLEPGFHGTDGPMVVSDLPLRTPAGLAFVAAAKALGHAENGDFNGSRQEGVGFYQSYQEGGVRVSSAGAYLTAEVRNRPNLTLETQALATRILFERRGGRSRAIGVAYEDQRAGGRRAETVEARREVLLACGAYDSPKLLMLSGIGPADELAKHGIELRHHLPGVGKNLQDHLIAPVVYAYKEGTQPSQVIGYGIEGGLFLKTRRERHKPDLQLILNHALLGPPQTPVVPVAFMVVPLLVNPESRGVVRLGGSFAGSPPSIDGNFLSKEADLRLMVEGVKIALTLARHQAFDAIRGPRMFPPPKDQQDDTMPTDGEIREFIRGFAGTLFHPAGTCRMGRSSRDAKHPAVVDGELRVHGVDGLRVVDASIMPSITTGNTHTPTAMIAEKAAEMIAAARPGQLGQAVPQRSSRPGAEPAAGGGSAGPAPGNAAQSAPAVPAPTIPVENTAQAYLELLEALGVRYFFGNAGSDFPSLIDAFARRTAQGKTAPRPLLVPHEMCAVSMAHGYHLVSGEPPVVMVHSTVGTANALCGLINASRSGIPLILTAGRTPVHEEGVPGSRELVIHWSQEALDQGSLTRAFTKWDYELRSFPQLETVVRRAFALATTEPQGPVYLTLPRDLLAEPQTELTLHPPVGASGLTAAAAPYPDPEAVARAARLLAQASQPLILTRSFGRRPEAVRHLVDLAEAFAIPVVEYQIPEFLNFPHSHPLHLGFGGPPSGIALLDQADVILAIDCPMPWAPDQQRPRPGVKVIHVGVDPLQARYPIWGFPATLAIPAPSATTVALLAGELRRLRPGREAEIEARGARIRQLHDQQRAAWAAIARQGGAAPISSFFWVSHCLSQIKDDDMIVVQEYNLALEAIPFDEPGSYVGFAPSGGLGFGVGGALGVKLGAPEKTVVSVIGDGTYVLGSPSAAHMVSAQYGLPILWVVTNNRGWAAMAWQTDSVHANGWAKRANDYPLTRFGVDSAWEKVVEAFGGHGEVVRQPRELPGALKRALRVVREEKRQALVNVHCDFYFWDPSRAGRPEERSP